MIVFIQLNMTIKEVLTNKNNIATKSKVTSFNYLQNIYASAMSIKTSQVLLLKIQRSSSDETELSQTSFDRKIFLSKRENLSQMKMAEF